MTGSYFESCLRLYAEVDLSRMCLHKSVLLCIGATSVTSATGATNATGATSDGGVVAGVVGGVVGGLLLIIIVLVVVVIVMATISSRRKVLGK